ncbi:hypothetical protein T029_23070 [Salmonella enterica subsp. enterica serovar Give]|nr:hypothetical protein [Salmonella enterica subsp. enterica serovar Give]ECM4405512.1 hypothetical protein [Salmonella enterica subsp. enterica serovar Give]EED3923394.1 hypothetical protein [Salmonella enterica subsp. enterica serovar Give]EED4548218.1 hypothetical protein [Salmonella enterica subsp. enterica serovar Give]
MAIFPEIDVNVCKSENCKNFALPNQTDYTMPSYKLGYAAIHCNKCGGNSFLVNNEDIKSLLYPYVDFYLKNVTGVCPKCFRDDTIKYGSTRKGSTRYQCKSCKTVFSPWAISDSSWPYAKLLELLFSNKTISEIIKFLDIPPTTFYRKLQQLDSYLETRVRILESSLINIQPKHIQTNIIRLKCREENKTGLSNDLLGLISCCGTSGYVLLSSMNWTEKKLQPDSLYTPSNNTPFNDYRSSESEGVGLIYNKYEELYNRPSFDQIKYSGRLCSPQVIEPITMAHVHFQKLKFIHPYPALTNYIYHDVFIRAACMTTYGSYIREKKCNVFYVLDSDKDINGKYTYNGSYKIGWWGNIWHEYIDVGNTKKKYVCKLCNLTSDNPYEYIKLPASLCYTKKFISKFHEFFSKERVESISPKNVILILSLFEKFYNFCICSDNTGLTPGQKNNLASKSLTIDELLKL